MALRMRCSSSAGQSVRTRMVARRGHAGSRHEVGQILGVERQAAGHGFVEQDSHRVDIGTDVDLLTAKLLGRHVVRGSDDDAFARERAFSDVGAHDLADAEVHELDDQVAARLTHDHGVVGLDVAVDGPGVVYGGESGQELPRHFNHGGDGQQSIHGARRRGSVRRAAP